MSSHIHPVVVVAGLLANHDSPFRPCQAAPDPQIFTTYIYVMVETTIWEVCRGRRGTGEK
jgi:hypothetical protein